MHSRSARAFCLDMYAEDLCPSWQHIALARIESGARCAAGFLASSRPLGVITRIAVQRAYVGSGQLRTCGRIGLGPGSANSRHMQCG